MTRSAERLILNLRNLRRYVLAPDESMAVFAYRVSTRGRDDLEGTIAADSPSRARELLRERGYLIRDVSPIAGNRSSGVWHLPSWRRRRGSVHEVAGCVRDLSTLLAVGIPLLQSLDALIAQTEGPFATTLLQLRDRVAAGASLAEAMGEQPETFDSLSIRMVEVGENAGTLDAVLRQLADFRERSLELRDRVTGALLYPLIVLVAAIGVSLFLMTAVVPTLLDNLVEAGRTLPWPTVVLKTISDALLRYGPAMGLGFALTAIPVATFASTDRGKRLWQRWLLKLPLFGELARKQAVARVSLVLAVLMRSGIEFLNAVEIAGRSIGNLVIRDGLERAAAGVQAGRDIGEALDETGVFPAVAVQVFSVGQQTGHLEEMLERLSSDYDRQVTTLSQRLATILEPILILLLSVLVGFILFATILPILEAGNVL